VFCEVLFPVLEFEVESWWAEYFWETVHLSIEVWRRYSCDEFSIVQRSALSFIKRLEC
jgi:hypothetical protein